MTDPERQDSSPRAGDGSPLSGEVERRAERIERGRRRGRPTAWFGLGMFGLVGWSVAVPTLLGTALGVWLDRRWSADVSWTLTFLIIGVALGCLNAWFWIRQESRRG